MTSSKTPERLLFIPTTTEKLKEVLDGGLFPLISEALADDLDDKLLFQSIATRILNKDFDLLIAAMWLRARKGHKFNFAEYQIEDYMYDVVSSALEVCFHHYPSLSQYSHGTSFLRNGLTELLQGEILERIVRQIQKLYNSPDAVGEVIAADQPPAESLFRRVRSFNWWHSNDQTFFDQQEMTKLSGILTDLQSFIGEWETAKLTQIDLRFHHYTQLTLFLSTVERTFCLYENDASEQIKNSLELTQLKQLYHELATSLTGLGFSWESYFRFREQV